MPNSRVSVQSVVLTIVIGMMLLLTVLAMFDVRFPVLGVRWSNVPPVDQPSTAGAKSDPGRFASIDQVLEGLEFANIALSAPQTAKLHQTTVIELYLGLSIPLEELRRQFEGAGEKEFSRIRVSQRIEARLSGSNFAVLAMTPEEQAIDRTGIIGWKWEVKPMSTGRHSLHLTLSTPVPVGDVRTRTIRTFDKRMGLDVAQGKQLWSLHDKKSQWLYASHP